ncbi:MAG: DUF2029 domain-containing protein [Anaerolineae bacterium]|nr:DUF2029 domain-containing protein [Anaerolineae bacterium]
MKTLPLDTIVLLLLGTACISRLDEFSAAFLIILLGVYALLDLVASPAEGSGATRRVRLAKLAIVLMSVSLVVVLPMLSRMLLRRSTAPWLYVHDGAIQTEESIRFLLRGQNPYTEDYLETPLAEWDYSSAPSEVNPALYHNAYLPFNFIFSAPFYTLTTWLTGWYDQRVVHLLLFVGASWLYMRHANSATRRLSLLAIFGLNFFGVPNVVWGGNDVFVFFWLVACTYLLRQDRTTLAAICLGLACASKQTAWLFVPFFLTYVWSTERQPGASTRLRKVYPVVLVPLLVMLPFLLWDAASFVDDTYLYLSGRTAFSYPISGIGFGGLLLTLGLVDDKHAFFPFILLQVSACVPLLIFLLRRQWRHGTVQRCWYGYALMLLFFEFFSRFFASYYLGTIVNALGLGYLSEDS